MTVPLLGIVGIVFIFLFFVIGIVLVILYMSKPSFRKKVRELIGPYRSRPPKRDKASHRPHSSNRHSVRLLIQEGSQNSSARSSWNTDGTSSSRSSRDLGDPTVHYGGSLRNGRNSLRNGRNSLGRIPEEGGSHGHSSGSWNSYGQQSSSRNSNEPQRGVRNNSHEQPSLGQNSLGRTGVERDSPNHNLIEDNGEMEVVYQFRPKRQPREDNKHKAHFDEC